MLNYLLKVLLVSSITLLSFISPVFAAVRQQMQVSARYFDDLQDQDTPESYKAKRKLHTQRIREEILRARLRLKDDNSDLAKAVIDRKVRIAREREFLASEFSRGVEALYQKAVAAYDQQQFAISRKDFVEVEKLFPDYRDTRRYLTKLAVSLDSISKSSLDSSLKINQMQSHQLHKDEVLSDLQIAARQGDQK